MSADMVMRHVFISAPEWQRGRNAHRYVYYDAAERVRGEWRGVYERCVTFLAVAVFA